MLEEEVTAGWGLMCSLIVVLVYICRKRGRVYERTDFNSNCFILFFVISLMHVCINSYVKFTRFSDRIDFVKLLLLLLKKGVNNYGNDNVQLN